MTFEPRPPAKAPEGHACPQHPERAAQATCPQCDRHQCIGCFQLALGLCEQCLKRDPSAYAAPIPFEDRSRGLLARIGLTLLTALHPVRSAPAFATQNRRDALSFALLTALPLALLSGVIPHTRTLLFGAGQIEVIGAQDSMSIALDVARAGLIQLGLTTAYVLSLMLPFTSLVRAYAGEVQVNYAIRCLLYRVWLVPFGLLLLLLASYLSTPLPELLDSAAVTLPPLPPLLVGAGVLKLVTEVLLLLSMGFTARMACGLSALWTLVVVGVPLLVSFFVGHAGSELVVWLLPQPSVAGGGS